MANRCSYRASLHNLEKRFAVPGQHLQQLLDVYGLSQHLELRGAICCESLEVSKFYVSCLLSTCNGVIPLQICDLKGLWITHDYSL